MNNLDIYFGSDPQTTDEYAPQPAYNDVSAPLAVLKKQMTRMMILLNMTTPDTMQLQCNPDSQQRLQGLLTY